MKKTIALLSILICFYSGYACQNTLSSPPLLHGRHKVIRHDFQTGADQTELYVSYLKNKKIAIVLNPTSVIGNKHVSSVDSLLKLGLHISKIFGPEHGFRGNASDGAAIKDTLDAKTGIPAISLYGKHYKPTPADLKGISIVVFDIQDVGTRFYTFLSTLHYVMEACAENKVELMILDRPNPNGFYVDGPVLDTAFRSFVGLDPIPIVHGMTFGEYAQMLNGEGWLKGKIKCKLRVIKMAYYSHDMPYILPINPSPNLNTAKAILLYPSICLFEGTDISLGRGTLFPFQVLGHPALNEKYSFSFTPKSIAGMSEDPPQKNKLCYGIDLRDYDTSEIRKSKKIDILWLKKMYDAFPDKAHFFNAYFSKLAGTDLLRKQIEEGRSEQEIRASWEPALSNFKTIRSKYLLYP